VVDSHEFEEDEDEEEDNEEDDEEEDDEEEGEEDPEDEEETSVERNGELKRTADQAVGEEVPPVVSKKRKKIQPLGEFPCDVAGCGKIFGRKTYLEAHKKGHSGEKPHLCGIDGCTKTFAHRTTLLNHRLIHQGEKPHSCPHLGCGRTYRQLSHLMRHEQMEHSTGRTVVCGDCGKNFGSQEHLRTHTLIHKAEKSHACNVEGCGKSFKQTSQLTDHKRRHEVSLSFLNLCSFGFFSFISFFFFFFYLTFRSAPRLDTCESSKRGTTSGCSSSVCRLTSSSRHTTHSSRSVPRAKYQK